jgi:hypothetical protein
VIKANGEIAIFVIDARRGLYAGCEVIAWEDGTNLAVCRDARAGKLSPAVERPGFVTLLAGSPPRGSQADHEEWFRRTVGISKDAPLYMHEPESGGHMATAYKLVPTLPTQRDE